MTYGTTSNTVSTPVTLNKIKEVFGGPDTFRSYLRGAGYVLNISNVYPTIVNTGNLAMSTFANAVYPPAIISNGDTTLYDSAINPSQAIVRLYFNGDYMYTEEGGSVTSNTKWLIAGSNVDFDIRFSKVSGTTHSPGTVNTWLSLSTYREWLLGSLTSGTDYRDSSGYLELRMNASPQTIIANANVRLTVSHSSGA